MNMDQGGIPERFRRSPTRDEKPEAVGAVALRPFIFRDPPDHTRLRGLVSAAFTPKVVQSLRDQTQSVVDELLDAAIDAGDVDLLEEFTHPLPVRVICDLLGVPVADHDRFKVWSEALAQGLDPDFLLTDEIIEARGEAVMQFAQYFFELLAERRKSPGPDLISRLIEVRDGSTVLTETEMMSTSIMLLVAGHETTVNLLSGGILALLRNPDQLARFRSDPDVHRTGIEEMMRYVSPVQLTTRTFTEDCSFGGTEFAAGDFAMLLIASANHDSAQFEDAERFDVTRNPNNHLGLGFGIHHCIGAPLARMQATVALTTLLRRAPKLALATDQITYKPNIIFRGMRALPVSMGG
jgi:unspecific monooxygenase